MEKREYTFADATGDACITVYQVFPGVQLAYHNVHMQQLDVGMNVEGNMIEIQHCREGRIEQEFEDDYFYLMPGDLSLARRTRMVKAYSYPLRHYHGINIGINLDLAAGDFQGMLDMIGVHPGEILQKLCSDRNCFVIRAERYIEHVISELYTIDESIREGYIKLKVLELLLILNRTDVSRRHSSMCGLPKGQVRLAHRAAAYLLEHMDRHITISELARKLEASETHLKTTFREVYGVPIFSYIRLQKMQAAAQQLIHTEKTVAELSEAFGYANTSKFAAAFQAEMGETPREYRRLHTGKNPY